jgi:NAD(P)-dependent dehydrogenase (short-subunit alcohol dehydrogenase family)
MDRKKIYFTAAGIGAGLLVRSVMRKPASADLFGKVVMITGRASGLGLALAREFAAEGCRLALAANDPAELGAAQAELESRRAHVFTARCDVTNLAHVDGAAEAVLNRFGHVDILINNAGQIEITPAGEMSLEDFERAMDLMFWGVVYPTRAVLPHMLDRKSGRIVNIVADGSSIAPHLLPRDCAKFAAIGFSEGLRAELLPQGIPVLTIVPAPAMSEARMARHIVTATGRGEANGLGVAGRTDVAAFVHELLADSETPPNRQRKPMVKALTTIGRFAARRYLSS